MIAADTGAWTAFFPGAAGEETALLDSALRGRYAVMPPVVLAELLSDPGLPHAVSRSLSELALLKPGPGSWQRAGRLRARVLAAGRKARLGDALIAPSCIGAKVPLPTRARDFRAFARAAGLRLILPPAAPQSSTPVSTHRPSRALCSTASHTFCVCRALRKSGCTFSPVSSPRTKSARALRNVCS